MAYTREDFNSGKPLPQDSDSNSGKGGGSVNPGDIVPPPTTGGGTIDNPTWYVPTNVYAPPGVDPYYGVSITGINGSTNSGSGSTIPDSQGGLGGSTKADRNGDNDADYQAYLRQHGGGTYWGGAYVPSEDAMSYSEWQYWRNGSDSSNSGINYNTGDFKIARPNMTWANSLPTVIPANGQEALNAYAPLPFTREANTPGASYIKPSLTYNNPYNTNPYLPTANPFALIANAPTNGS